MAADDLAPCVARTLTAMVLTMQDKQVFVFLSFMRKDISHMHCFIINRKKIIILLFPKKKHKPEVPDFI